MIATADTVPQTRPVTRPSLASRSLDISRGAEQHAIRAMVFLDRSVITDYVEMDPALGQNVIGVILSVLSCHLALGQGRLDDDRITVCLVRRQDGRLVEVDLTIGRRRHAGRECLVLRQLTDRVVEE